MIKIRNIIIVLAMIFISSNSYAAIKVGWMPLVSFTQDNLTGTTSSFGITYLTPLKINKKYKYLNSGFFIKLNLAQSHNSFDIGYNLFNSPSGGYTQLNLAYSQLHELSDPANIYNGIKVSATQSFFSFLPIQINAAIYLSSDNKIKPAIGVGIGL